MGKRLTERQKEEISNLFTSGVNIEDLAIQFKCTKFTITRNIKKKIGEDQYNLVINKKKSNKLNNNTNTKYKIEKQDQTKTLNNKKEAKKRDYLSEELATFTDFIEITPLNLDIDNSPQKDLTSISINDVNLPKSVYMIVDKKVELEIKYLKDFPKWNFLSQDELNRKTIEIYYDLKTAKSFCQKEQKVIKVPNTNIFKLVAPILSSRGISRIISAENLISL